MKTISKDIKALAIATIASALTLVGCQDPDYPTPNVTVTGPATSTARALFVNASPNSPALNFLVENVQMAQSLAPGQNSNYVTIPVGNIQLRAKAASGAIGGTLGSNDILYRAGATNQNNFASTVNTNYSIFVTDTIQRPAPTTPAGVTNPGGPQFLFVTDTLTAPAAGNAKFRFFNLSPDVTGVASSTTAGPVSIRILNASGASVATFANRAYRTATGTTLRYTSLPAGTYVTQVYSGTAVLALTVTPVASSTVTMADGKIYTLYSQGLRRNNTLSVGVVQHN